jgi:hypothetical protein|tara:strand:- start:172 stop:384 length:213 start_codon:yes stop_codon:yes gene_type:complete
MKKEELKQEAPTVIACCVKCGKPTNLEQYVDKILIEELEESIKDVTDYKEGNNVVVDRILSRLISLKLKQ